MEHLRNYYFYIDISTWIHLNEQKSITLVLKRFIREFLWVMDLIRMEKYPSLFSYDEFLRLSMLDYCERKWCEQD